MVKTINETVNNTSIEVINKNINTASQSGVTTQTIDMDGMNIVGCVPDFSQSSSVSLRSMQSIDASTSATLVNDITAALEAKARQTAASSSSLASQPSTSSNITETVNSVKNDLKVALSNENINAIIQKVNQEQTMKSKKTNIDPCGMIAWSEKVANDPSLEKSPLGKAMSESIGECIKTKPMPKCSFSQVTTANLVVQQITSSVLGVVSNNKMAQKLTADIESAAKAESKGLGDMIGDIFKGLFGGLFSGIGTYISACCAVAICLCCCVLVLMVGGSAAASSGGGGGNAAGANAGR
jgi:hypothetical protein